MVDVDIFRDPYKGSGPALNDLVGGQVNIMFPIRWQFQDVADYESTTY